MPTDYLEEEYDVVNSEDELSDSSAYNLNSSSDETSSSESDDSDSDCRRLDF